VTTFDLISRLATLAYVMQNLPFGDCAILRGNIVIAECHNRPFLKVTPKPPQQPQPKTQTSLKLPTPSFTPKFSHVLPSLLPMLLASKN
jgi:hypothetical protein